MWHGLCRVVQCFLTMMAVNKREIFKHPNEFKTYVLDNFYPYFQPLKDLVKEWFHLLILAHKFRAFEYYTIHDIGILDCALEPTPPDGINEAVKNVLDQKANIEKLSDANTFNNLHLRIHLQ